MGDVKYLLPNEQDEKWEIVTTTVGLQEGHPGEPYPYGDHPASYLFSSQNGRIMQEYGLVYIYKGSGWFASAHCEKVPIVAGDAFMFFPGEWHNYAPSPETGWSEAWIGFRGDYIDRLVSRRLITVEQPVFKVGVNAFLWDMFARAFKISMRQSPAYQQQLAGYVTLLLGTTYAGSQWPAQQDTHLAEQMMRAKQYMESHIQQNICMEDVAREIGMGYSSFRKVFKSYTGFSPALYYKELRIVRAKELLLGTSLTCKAVAYKMGFESVAYFHEFFRQHQGISPSEFRKANQARR